MTSDPISLPNLKRDAPPGEVNEVIGNLVRKFKVPIKLEDKADEDGNAVIEVSYSDPAVLDALLEEVNSK